MTTIEKEKVRYLRGEGLGYKAIAAQLEVSVNAVKGFCKRNGLSGVAATNADDSCRQCGKLLIQNPKSRKRKYCSDNCRALWWSRHSYLITPKEQNKCVCVHCGCAFYSGPSKNRKYCGRPCYIAARFGGERP